MRPNGIDFLLLKTGSLDCDYFVTSFQDKAALLCTLLAGSSTAVAPFLSFVTCTAGALAVQMAQL